MLKAMFNGGKEGKAQMEGEGRDKEVASSKFNTSIKKSIPYLWPRWRQNAKIDSLFMTKTAEKPYPLGPHIPI